MTKVVKKFRLFFMNNDFNRNCRTLIVCFVIALMFLVPLRFVEFSNQIIEISNAEILGASTVVKEEVVLPNDEVEEVFLEAPYNEIEEIAE